MSSARRLYGLFDRSDGRIRLLTLLGVSGLVAVMAIFMVLPAFAGSEAPSGKGVTPTVVSYGGGAGACAVYSDAANELHINNPYTGTFTGPDGTKVEITVDSKDQFFRFNVKDDPSKYVWDVVVNGGPQNTFYDYLSSTVGAVQSDSHLHAPSKGNKPYKLSHINICYDVKPTADLGVSKTPVSVNGDPSSAEPFVANVGDTVEFEITVSNAGPLDASGVTVTDTLPTGMMFDPANTGNTGWTEAPTGVVTYELGGLAAGHSESLSLFVTITDSAAGQPVTNQVSVMGDQDDDDTENDSAGSVPPVTVTADISGIKYHDRDTDGTKDPTEEEVLPGWTMTAFASPTDPGTSATTGSDGSYAIENLTPGTYTVCEMGPDQATLPSTDPSKLPVDGSGYEWSWATSEPSGASTADCGGFSGYLPIGYEVTIGSDGDVGGIDFGNHTQVSINCDGGPVSVPLGGDGTDDNPKSVVTVPGDCSSGTFVTAYDVGRSDKSAGDPDDWDQFVVFGGAVGGTTQFSQSIVWDAEIADYPDGSLVVPTTQVVLMPGGSPQDAPRCGTDGPSATVPLCLVSRTIEEGITPLAWNEIQVAENYAFLGDPGFFR